MVDARAGGFSPGSVVRLLRPGASLVPDANEMTASSVIDRATATDLGQLASDAGSVPNQIGAVLVLDPRDAFDASAARIVVSERLARVPRLRQRLVSLPSGYGRPIWLDDPRFDVAEHVSLVRWSPPRPRSALHELAAQLVTARLPRDRPPWSATLVAGLEGGKVGLIVVFHHVMADGIGGLAVLSQLLDGAADPTEGGGGVPPTPGPVHPRRPPSRAQLRRDAAARRRAALRALPGSLTGLRAGIRELGSRPTVAPRCSLNAPTGSRRRIAVVRTDLASVRSFAHAHGATVNDVLLTAVANALATLLRHRGEHVDRLVASIPVAAREPTGAPLGNRAGIAPIEIPLRGSAGDRLREVAAVTRLRKQDPGASAALTGVGLRVLARLRLLGWFIDRQRMVHTFVTNLRGPVEPVSVDGLPVTDLIPISLTTGNVTVAFAALSYAGTLTVTVVVDPDRHPDLDVLVRALTAELDVDGRSRP